MTFARNGFAVQSSMPTFTIGEEVLHDDVRYVIAGIRGEGEPRFRLLATRPEGTRFMWATKDEIQKIAAYTEPRDDTGRV